MNITDEMVGAAMLAYMKETAAEEFQVSGWLEPALRAALTAALAVQTQQGVEVKPLEWTRSARAGSYVAHGAGIMYAADQDHDCVVLAKWEGASALKSAHDTMEQAQAFAQSDYETRIRSALVDVPAVESEPVGEQWCAYEEGHQHTSWYPDGYGDRAGWAALAKRNPEKYQVVARPVYAHPARSLSNEGGEIDTDLLARCKEIVEWKRTGRLPGEKLRTLGRSIANRLGGSLFIDNGLNQAELQTIDEALKFIIALSTRKGSAGDGSAPTTKGCAE